MEAKTRNGYYQFKDKQFPRVSSIIDSCGSKYGLIQWAAKQGGLGVVHGLAKIQNVSKLGQKLNSPACYNWAQEQAVSGLKEEGDRVRDIGSRIHESIECLLKKENIVVTDNPLLQTALETFENFYKDIEFDPIAIETSVYSEKYEFAGTLDLVAELNEEQTERLKPYLSRNTKNKVKPGLLICDIKTGSLYPKSMKVQLAAYRQAYKETYKRECNGGLIINITREEPEKINCVYFTEEELDEAFNHGLLPAIEVWKYFDSPKWFREQIGENDARME